MNNDQQQLRANAALLQTMQAFCHKLGLDLATGGVPGDASAIRFVATLGPYAAERRASMIQLNAQPMIGALEMAEVFYAVLLAYFRHPLARYVSHGDGCPRAENAVPVTSAPCSCGLADLMPDVNVANPEPRNGNVLPFVAGEIAAKETGGTDP
jgi:hypothetical protein